MSTIEVRVDETIRRHGLIANGQSAVVAVSGGPDSVALIVLLSRLYPDCRLTAVYVDHNLRPHETGREKALVSRLSHSIGAACEVAVIDVSAEQLRTGDSPEATARKLRYRALNEIRLRCKADLIAVGHTRDDQAEEVLLRLIRGTGLKGLTGMSFSNGPLIRPLLAVDKAEILDFLAVEGIDYCIDSSNTSRAFLRNRIRLDLLPSLARDYNPSIKEILVNTAAILSADENCLEAQADRVFNELKRSRQLTEPNGVRKEISFRLDRLQEIDLSLRRRLYEKSCWFFGRPPNFNSIDRIDRLTGSSSPTGSSLSLAGGLSIVKTADSIVFSVAEGRSEGRRQEPAAFDQTVVITGEGQYNIEPLGATFRVAFSGPDSAWQPGRIVVDAIRATFPLSIRAPLPGERFRPLGAPGSKKISRLLSDRKIPRHRRYRYPVLVGPAGIIAILGLAVGEDFKVGPQTVRVLAIDWTDPGVMPDVSG